MGFCRFLKSVQGFTVFNGVCGVYRVLCGSLVFVPAPATFVTRGRLNSWTSKVRVTNIFLKNVS